MLKKFAAIAFLCVATSLFALSEGKEYFKLSSSEQLPNSENTVIELFSYGCIHCYNQFRNGTLKAVSNALPNLKYEEWQVREMGQFGEDFVKILAYAKMVDEKNGLDSSLDEKSSFHEILSSYFTAHFQFKLQWNTQKDFYSIALNILKTTQDEIEKYAQNDGQAYLNRVNNAIKIVKKSGTPAFVVNGKYLVNIEEVNSVEDLIAIIKELVELKDN